MAHEDPRQRGAGYIGSHTVIQLVAAGHDVVIVDNFSNSHPVVKGRMESLTGTSLPLHSFDLCDYDKTEHLFAAEDFDAVIHFAGYKAVGGESVEKPLEYYENNLGSTFSLVRAMQKHDVDKLVFSSSATVYGTDQAGATEDQPTFATNPYGWTKVMQEQILRDVAAASRGMRVALLRYFNPVGAHPSGTIGEDPSGSPTTSRRSSRRSRSASATSSPSSVTTTTPSTAPACATTSTSRTSRPATSRALEELTRTDKSVNTWNLGSGHGTSVLEMLHAFERAVGRELPYEVVPRRPGDVASSYADASRANAELGWRTEKSIDDMAVDAWRWQSQNPQGFAG